MGELLLLVAIVGIAILGYLIMGRLDDFFIQNYQSIEQENEVQEPSHIMLTDELSEEEILEEIRRFKQKHKTTRIYIRDESKIKETSK